MNKLLVICGPTATGKTALAIQLAKKLNGELVSADSRQVYRGMDIGTGKDLKDKTKISSLCLQTVYNNRSYDMCAYGMDGVPLWMYDVISPDEDFSVAHYYGLARIVIESIWKRNKLPILVGGTGFYIDSLIHPPSSLGVAPDDTLRQSLSNLSVEELQRKLQGIAPDVYDGLNNSDKHNSRRLVRKIEIAQTQIKSHVPSPSLAYDDIQLVGLTASMEQIQKRIHTRVASRLKEGIVAEISQLLSLGYSWNLPSMNSLGYIQWKLYFEKPESERDQIVNSVLDHWEHDEYAYAKRQLTWFKKNPHIKWFDVTLFKEFDHMTRSVLTWYTEA